MRLYSLIGETGEVLIYIGFTLYYLTTLILCILQLALYYSNYQSSSCLEYEQGQIGVNYGDWFLVNMYCRVGIMGVSLLMASVYGCDTRRQKDQVCYKKTCATIGLIFNLFRFAWMILGLSLYIRDSCKGQIANYSPFLFVFGLIQVIGMIYLCIGLLLMWTVTYSLQNEEEEDVYIRKENESIGIKTQANSSQIFKLILLYFFLTHFPLFLTNVIIYSEFHHDHSQGFLQKISKYMTQRIDNWLFTDFLNKIIIIVFAMLLCARDYCIDEIRSQRLLRISGIIISLFCLYQLCWVIYGLVIFYEEIGDQCCKGSQKVYFVTNLVIAIVVTFLGILVGWLRPEYVYRVKQIDRKRRVEIKSQATERKLNN